MRKIFLACPYSHADANVVQQRFIACNDVAAAIVRAAAWRGGAAAYLPLANSPYTTWPRKPRRTCWNSSRNAG
ncbi:DUF1937 family protein [Serratia marcescens]|uniref:DUF1937 family protein n=1 Tax=Serratia marcescens TaxID=615 RepID=UPI0034E858FC